VVHHSDRQATGRFRRAGKLATADTGVDLLPVDARDGVVSGADTARADDVIVEPTVSA